MNLARATFDRVARMSFRQAYGRICRPSLAHLPWSKGADVLVVANGPSVAVALPVIANRSWGGEVIAVDGAMARCVRHGFYPDLVVSADPHERIAHWFGAEPDDYFARIGEAGRTGEDIRGQRIALATATHRHTFEAIQKAGGMPYWFHAMLDDPGAPDSLTRKLYDANPLPVINGGGNVGTTAWVIAHSILGAKTVGLVGFDFGYPPGFPEERTQYAPELQAMYGDDWRDAFVRYPSGWYADPTMAWFREVFMEMAASAPCRTVNCGVGGALDIERMPLEEFLR